MENSVAKILGMHSRNISMNNSVNQHNRETNMLLFKSSMEKSGYKFPSYPRPLFSIDHCHNIHRNNRDLFHEYYKAFQPDHTYNQSLLLQNTKKLFWLNDRPNDQLNFPRIPLIVPKIPLIAFCSED